MGLEIKFLLQDPCENELCSDDGEGRRHSGATQLPVLLAGNHYSLRLRIDERKSENQSQSGREQQFRNMYLMGRWHLW